MKRIFILSLVMVMLLTLIGCQKEEKVDLKKNDLGYNFSDFLDQDGEDLIKQLEADGVELKLVADHSDNEYPMQGKLYQITEEIFGLEYEVKLTITMNEDGEKSSLVNIQKRIEFAKWPEGAEAEAIQKTVNALIYEYEKLYGETTNIDADHENIMEGIPSDKSVQWYKAEQTFCGMEIMYDPTTEQTIVTIQDMSAAWMQKLMEFYENH